MYATVTGKGQITLPAPVRRALGIEAGQRIEVRLEERRAVIEAPAPVAHLRQALEREARERGTWGKAYSSGDGWAARVREAGDAES
ncbi:MAG: AbrB/MazE/SpoVT family DNA-binding domain-containing protein [Propionibacteriaceae bacterium]|jgi:AbrB family looped-hinge helix DNA binding protein|nr:AbrB/MazE/SpoVT family DNA-binding domain-containing protein [Propionibacteriaceae bacterium]